MAMLLNQEKKALVEQRLVTSVSLELLSSLKIPGLEIVSRVRLNSRQSHMFLLPPF
jgi:hypothetical protein